ncbi:phage minor capsid protein [Gracilibacillus thailandensis]|uniref:Minor capsid protein n=1 Tax=Gracilibacillus thailandensis TaxID=563735 RepID=A0A6N7QW86_9BACI|nr:phage minor capsid protein [Gracilibacillus thailandensis]MRI65155.1 minor capsid protein [Gracilibacillus thailandensis]
MDKRELQRISQPVTDVYLSIESGILLNIAKRLGKHDSLLTEDDIQAWQTQALNELESLSNENIQFIASQSGKTTEEVRKALDKAGFGALVDNEDILEQGVKAGVLNEAPPMRESAALAGILTAYERQALQTFNLVNTTMLDQSRIAYLDIINSTTGEVLAGISTPDQALRKTVRKWSEVGTPALIRKDGARLSSEAYVNMVMRSTSNNVANDLQDERFREYGLDLFEVSSYPGARPKCFEDQGKIYSLSGNDPNYPSLASTSYGQPDGLFGIHCSHVKYAYIPGISKRRYKNTTSPEVNDRIYNNSQKQRYLERQIRYAKREQAMLEQIGDTEGAEIARRKVLDRQANQRAFIKQTGRTRRYAREQIH